MRGHGRVETGREGLHPDWWGEAPQNRRDGDAMTRQILALRDHLVAKQITCVVMEATGDYWKPFYALLDDLPGVQMMLLNARHVKNLPGRKTDVSDATWLAQLGAHGLLACPISEHPDAEKNRSCG